MLTIARNLALNELKRRKREILKKSSTIIRNSIIRLWLNPQQNCALIERALSVPDNEERNVVLLHDVRI